MSGAGWLQLSTLLLLAGAGAVGAAWLRGRMRWLPVVALPLLALLPPAGPQAWIWLAGVAGELSWTSLLLLTGYVVRRTTGREILGRAERTVLRSVIIVAGIVLYPSALGLGTIDAYRWGYGSMLPLLLLFIAVACWMRGWRSLAVLLLGVVLTARLGLAASPNLWDYLLDPLVWSVSLALTIIAALRRGDRRTAD